METKRLHTIVHETFKTLNNLKLAFMEDIFHDSPNVTHKKHDLTSILKIQQSLEIPVLRGFWCKYMKQIN